MPLPTPEQVEKARLREEQARARHAALKARLNEASRKLDTRRKVIVGGLLIDAAGKEDRFSKALRILVGRVSRPQDLAAFTGWTVPHPDEGSEPAGVPPAPAGPGDARA